MTSEPTQRAGLLKGLSTLGALAALSIVVFHVHGINQLSLPPALGFIPQYFGLGVPLFTPINLEFGNSALAFAPAFALLVVSQCLAPIVVISNRVFAFLGQLSYGLYLCHPPIVFFLRPVYERLYALQFGDAVAFLLSVAVTVPLVVLAAWLSHIAIEGPGIKLAERLIQRRLVGSRAAQPATASP